MQFFIAAAPSDQINIYSRFFEKLCMFVHYPLWMKQSVQLDGDWLFNLTITHLKSLIPAFYFLNPSTEVTLPSKLTLNNTQNLCFSSTCMLSCGLAILNSSEARARSWLDMSSSTTARLIRSSPTTSSYWAGRICWWRTLAGQTKGESDRNVNHNSPSEGKIFESVDEWKVNLPSMGASCMTPWVSQKVSEGLWLYSLAWALRCTFIILVTLCLLMTFTVKWTGSPATGALSRVRKTNTPLDELAE